MYFAEKLIKVLNWKGGKIQYGTSHRKHMIHWKLQFSVVQELYAFMYFL